MQRIVGDPVWFSAVALAFRESPEYHSHSLRGWHVKRPKGSLGCGRRRNREEISLASERSRSEEVNTI